MSNRIIYQILQYSFLYSQILKHFWLLGHHPSHASSILKVLTTQVNNLNVVEIVHKLPRILKKDRKNLSETLRYFKKEGITTEMMQSIPEIFHLSTSEIKKRIAALMEIPMIYVLRKHSRFLLLVSDYHIVVPRIRYLEKENMNVATIHTLTTYKNYYEQ